VTPLSYQQPRHRWRLRVPDGALLTVQYDPFWPHWRAGPGEYVRRHVRDALGRATGSRSNADWILEAERGLEPDSSSE
jgi:hypothetical protein